MFKFLHFSYFFLLIFACSVQYYGQTSTELPQAKLSFIDEKRVFKIGEPIQLILTLSANPGANIIGDPVSPTEDDLIISPKDDLYYWLQQISLIQGYDDHVTGIFENQNQPMKLNFYLNDHYRFEKPGKYALKLQTRRIYTKGRRDIIKLTTNQIEFEIKEMSEAEEIERTKRLSAILDSNSQDKFQKYSSMQELNFLTGNSSTVEKAKRYLKGQSEFSKGLFIARNKTLAIKLLEEAFNDTNREIGHNLIGILSVLRRLQELESDNSPENKLIKFARDYEDKRLEELKREYLEELYKSLPNRNGNSLLAAIYTVFSSLPRDDVSSPEFTETKQFILQNFDKFNLFVRELFLSAYWDKLRTPALIPSIEKILYETKDIKYSISRITAVGKLIELDEKRAKPYVIQEIQKISEKQFSLHLEILAGLKDKFLPEIDEVLLKTIERLAKENDSRTRWERSRLNLLAARYASPKIYDELLNIYKTYSSQWEFDVKSGLLAYFAKVNDKEAKSLIELELAKLDIYQHSTLINDLIKYDFPSSVYKLLRQKLNGNDLYVAGTAAYYISKRGNKKDKSLLLARYYRWFNERFKINQDVKLRRSSDSFQINLISSLTGSKSWKLTEEERADLKATCSAEHCLRYFQQQK